MCEGIAASFKLYMHCATCSRNSNRRVDVPEAEDAPTSVDELLESAFLANLKFTCRSCESPTAIIVGVNEIRAAA